jgi:hypothetical protein
VRCDSPSDEVQVLRAREDHDPTQGGDTEVPLSGRRFFGGKKRVSERPLTNEKNQERAGLLGRQRPASYSYAVPSTPRSGR